MLEAAQAVAVVLTSLGALAWIGNTIYQSRRAASENKVDDANAESISVATLSATIKTLNAQMEAQDALHKREIERLQHNITMLEQKFERVLDELENERQTSRERGHELETYRLALTVERERVATLEERVDVLERALRANDIDPDDLNGTPI